MSNVWFCLHSNKAYVHKYTNCYLLLVKIEKPEKKIKLAGVMCLALGLETQSEGFMVSLLQVQGPPALGEAQLALFHSLLVGKHHRRERERDTKRMIVTWTIWSVGCIKSDVDNWRPYTNVKRNLKISWAHVGFSFLHIKGQVHNFLSLSRNGPDANMNTGGYFSCCKQSYCSNHVDH